MSQPQRTARQIFKKYEVITASTAEQLGLSVSALLLLGIGWQLSSPVMCIVKPDESLHYYVSMMLFEFVVDPLPEEPTQ